ncbi:MAG: hypothetical protein J5J00_05700 [Deltaproteobacteria bacterium]|nr:hypothetical protein [Deltaproteobacteria bacterium]
MADRCFKRLFFAAAVLLVPFGAHGEDPDGSVRPDMAAVFSAFKDLQKYMASPARFHSAENETEISRLLKTMSTRFHKVERLDSKYAKEPGFASTIKITNDMLDDVKNRFSEGNKEYALWRLRASYSYCVSCHARYELSSEYYDPGAPLTGLNSFEKGEFYMATRQFEKAKDAFLTAVTDPALKIKRMDALRNWLVIYVRISPDPLEAIHQINKIRNSSNVSQYEDNELKAWLSSLRRWQNESKVQIEPLRKAEHLIAQGVALDDSIADAKGAVELLRGTAILHKLMESRGGEGDRNRARILYLLGLGYSHLPSFFAYELPEVFLEQCIRDYPGTNESKLAFTLYRELISLGYTGSGGTRLPADVQLKLKELYDISHQEPRMRDTV